MFGRLFLLFVVVPIVELALLVRLGTLVGFWPTLALVLLTGALGAGLARQQGAVVLRQIRAEMEVGRVPTGRLLDGFLVLVGGILLVSPGVLTDLAGLLLLFPPTRAPLKRLAQRRLERMVRSGQMSFVAIRR